MALAKTVIDLPLGGGIDEGTHDHLIQPPRMDGLSNMRFDKTGAVVSRPAYEDLCASSAATSPHRVEHIAENGRTLVAFASDTARVLTDDDASATWAPTLVAGPRGIDIRSDRVGIGNTDATLCKTAVGDATICHAWQTDGGDVYVTVLDADTGVPLLKPTQVTGLVALRDAFHLVPVGGTQYVLTATDDAVTGIAYYSVITVSGVTVTVGAATAFIDPVTGGGMSLPRTKLRVHGLRTHNYFYTLSGGTGVHYLRRWTVSGSTVTMESVAAFSTSASPRRVFMNPEADAVYAFAVDATDLLVAYATMSTSLPSTMTYTSFHTLGGDEHVTELTSTVLDATGDMLVAWEVYDDTLESLSTYVASPTQASFDYIVGGASVEWVELSTAGVAIGATHHEYHCTLHAHAFTDRTLWTAMLPLLPTVAYRVGIDVQAEDPWAAWTSGYTRNTRPEDTERRLAYVVEVGGNPRASRLVAHVQLNNAMRRSYLEDLGFITAGVRDSPGDISECYETADGGTLVTSALTSDDYPAAITIADRKVMASSQHVGAVLASSGCVAYADGPACVEVAMPPPFVIGYGGGPDSSYMGGELVSVGAEARFRACWMRRAANGAVMRSAPSPEFTLIADANKLVSGSFAFGAPPPGFWDGDEDLWLEVYASPSYDDIITAPKGAYDGTYGRVFCEAWKLDASNHYEIVQSGRRLRWQDIQNPNQPWATYPVAFNLWSDLDLYTNGGVLANDIPPPPAHLAATRDRVWVIDAENRRRVVYTKPIGSGHAPGFSDFLTVEVPTDRELTALGAIGDIVLLFTERSVWALEAIGGPDSTGSGDWPPLRRISSDIGCVNPASVVTTDAGVFFEADGGIYVISEAGQLTRVGREVEGATELLDIVSAVSVPETQSVVFDGMSGVNAASLIYDIEHQQWSSYDHGQRTLTASAQLAGRHCYAYDNGAVVAERRDGRAFQDLAVMRTGWIHAGPQQGVQRVWRLGVLGRLTYSDPGGTIHLGTVTISVAYDYDDSDVDVYTINLDTVTQYDPLHLRVHLARQKCTALKVTIAHQPPTGEPISGTNVYARLELSSLSLEVGVKRGIRKIAHAGGGTVS